MGTITRRGLFAAAASTAAVASLGPAWGANNAPWSLDRANRWYGAQPWPVGCNFAPSTASNQLEMFQAATFDPATIERELGWTAAIGMNTVRVFLHNLLWNQDAAGFKSRLNQVLSIAAAKRIRPILVLFDSCWDPFPQLGPQRPPVPGVHNSRWAQAPGAAVLQDPGQYPALQAYVEDIVGTFARDPRILFWDVWNEPDNTNGNSYGPQEPSNKVALVNTLLPQVFRWARTASPTQPISSAIWQGDWSEPGNLNQTQAVQLAYSDITTFHSYGFVEDFEQRIGWLKRYGRPVICTEYLARDAGSLFETSLVAARRANVGAVNWGCVSGKTQTILPWDSWQHPYTTAEALGGTDFRVLIEPDQKWPYPYVSEDPVVWHHDIFRPDGTPYRKFETDLIRHLSAYGAYP